LNGNGNGNVIHSLQYILRGTIGQGLFVLLDKCNIGFSNHSVISRRMLEVEQWLKDLKRGTFRNPPVPRITFHIPGQPQAVPRFCTLLLAGTLTIMAANQQVILWWGQTGLRGVQFQCRVTFVPLPQWSWNLRIFWGVYA
jgi:hypothetical protein